MPRRPCQKNYISGYVWRKSFIHTVKCSFFNQIIVHQSFPGASLAFSYFFFEEKFCVLACVGKSFARMLIVWSVPKTLSRKWYLRLYLTQTVSNGKILFPRQENCLLKFLWCATHILLFLIFFKEKFCVSAHVSKSCACLDHVEKKLSFGCVCCMKMGLLKRVGSIWQKENGKFLI